MKESYFYDMCDIIEENPDTYKNALKGYIPSVDDLKTHKANLKPDIFAHIIVYFSTDPFRNEKKDWQNEIKERYEEVVEYAKCVVTQFELKE